MRRDYLTTYGIEALVIGSYLVVFHVVAQRMGASGFGDYALTRRALSMMAPLAVLGLDVALARQIAARGDRSEPTQPYGYAALVCSFAAALLVSVSLLLFAPWVGHFFFGQGASLTLVAALVALICGNSLHTIAYSYFRGCQRIQIANMVMGVNYVAVPLLSLEFSGKSLITLLFLTSLGWLVASIAFLLVGLGGRPARGLGPAARRLLTFGLPRVPGDFLQLALFAAPGILIVNIADLRTAGVVAFGVALIGMVGTAFVPISFVLMPAATRMFVDDAVADLRAHVLDLAKLVVVPVALGIVVAELLADTIITLYLGDAFRGTGIWVRILVLGTMPWAVFVAFKGVIDARYARPLNARNLAVAASTFAVLSVALVPGSGVTGVVWSFVLALYVLGGLTVRQVAAIVGVPAARRSSEAPDAQPIL